MPLRENETYRGRRNSVAALILWRRCDEPMALFVAMLLVPLGATFSGPVEAWGASVRPGSGSAQVYRYRRVSGPAQRQQTEWVVFGLAAALRGYLAVILVQVVFSSLESGALADFLFSAPAICFQHCGKSSRTRGRKS